LSSTTRRTLRALSMTLAVGTSLTALACAPAVHVTTATAPDVVINGRETFRILDVPVRRDGLSLAADDPMLTNSITNEALREDLTHSFESRGYAPSTEHPDFAVAYYASTRDKLKVSTWDYGYTWRGWPREYVDVDEYTQGTVIVDVVDPQTRTLLWRGQGVADVSKDPKRYTKELAKTVSAILNKFPQAAPRTTAGNNH
jgi:hypothetical protein